MASSETSCSCTLHWLCCEQLATFHSWQARDHYYLSPGPGVLLSRQVMGLCLGSDLWPAAFPHVLSDTSACALQSYPHFLLCVLLSGEQSVLHNILQHPTVRWQPVVLPEWACRILEWFHDDWCPVSGLMGQLSRQPVNRHHIPEPQ